MFVDPGTTTHYETIQSVRQVYLEALDLQCVRGNLEGHGQTFGMVYVGLRGLSKIQSGQVLLFRTQRIVPPTAVHYDLYGT